MANRALLLVLEMARLITLQGTAWIATLEGGIIGVRILWQSPDLRLCED